MKALTILLILFIAQLSMAKSNEPDSAEAMNQIKVGILPLMLFNTLEITYERSLKSNLTFGGTFRRNITKTEPHFFEFGKFSDLTFSGNRFGHFAIWQQLKWYPKLSNRRAPHGFYLGALLRYQNLSYRSSIEYEDLSTTTINVGFSASLYSFAFGLDIGYQIKVDDHWMLDISFFGPRVNQNIFVAKLDATVNNDILDELSDEVNNAIGFGIFNPRITMSQSVAQTFTFFGFRYAMSIGYCF